MKWLTHVFLLLLSTQLVGCAYHPSFLQNRDTEYLTAQSIPPLRIPPGIASEAFRSYYPVAHRQYPETAKNVSLVPPGLNG